MREYYYKARGSNDWKGPVNIFKLLIELIFSNIGASSEVWHKGICERVPPVEHPKECSHGTKKLAELSYIKHLFIRRNFKRSKDKKRFSAKVAIAIVSIGYAFIKVISITIFAFNCYNQTVNHYHLEYLEEFNDHVESLKQSGRIDRDTEIGVEVEPDKDYNLFTKSKNTLEVKYTIDFRVSDYELGQYDVMANKNTREAVKIFAYHLQQLEDAYRTKGPIDVSVYGSTDGAPIVSPIPYQGEYGYLLNKDYWHQKIKSSLSLSPGDTFEQNVVLGYLRGYSFWYYLKSYGNSFVSQETSFAAFVITNDERGGGYRSVQIVIKYYDVKT